MRFLDNLYMDRMASFNLILTSIKSRGRGNHDQASTGRCMAQRWVGSALGELRVGACTSPHLGLQDDRATPRRRDNGKWRVRYPANATLMG